MTDPNDLDYMTWLEYGITRRWITPPVCSTHDGVPSTPHEDDQWEEGHDPCLPILRIITDDTRTALEVHHPLLFRGWV